MSVEFKVYCGEIEEINNARMAALDYIDANNDSLEQMITSLLPHEKFLTGMDEAFALDLMFLKNYAEKRIASVAEEAILVCFPADGKEMTTGQEHLP